MKRQKSIGGRLAAPAIAALALAISQAPVAAQSDGPIVALLLKENQTPRYETRDRPTFEKQLAESCPTCQLKYYNAAGDVGRQLSQVESALTEGATVLVLNPVDASAAGRMVQAAHQQNAKVISYDQVIYDAGVDFAIDRLAGIFGSDIRKQVGRAMMTNWGAERTMRGAYAAARPGRAEARGVLAEPVDGRIHFAGEHLAGPLMQTCGGARLSGEAVALNVVRDLVGGLSG